jgi:hypothetical protein
MSEVLYGIVHGKTIELEQDPGLEDGRRVQVVLRQPKRLPGPPPGIARPSLHAAFGSHGCQKC